jgi:hypothetical protein
MGLLDVLTGGGLGAIAGAIGAIGNKIIDLKLKDKENDALKIKLDHDVVMRDKDLALAQAEANARFEMAKVDADVKAVTADMSALQASFIVDKATYTDSRWGYIIDFIRGSTRPVLTYLAMYLVIFMTIMTIKDMDKHPLTSEQSMEILKEVLFLAGLAISWWFGARPGTSKKG